jgi:hypothetical protein
MRKSRTRGRRLNCAALVGAGLMTMTMDSAPAFANRYEVVAFPPVQIRGRNPELAYGAYIIDNKTGVVKSCTVVFTGSRRHRCVPATAKMALTGDNISDIHADTTWSTSTTQIIVVWQLNQDTGDMAACELGVGHVDCIVMQ